MGLYNLRKIQFNIDKLKIWLSYKLKLLFKQLYNYKVTSVSHTRRLII